MGCSISQDKHLCPDCSVASGPLVSDLVKAATERVLRDNNMRLTTPKLTWIPLKSGNLDGTFDNGVVNIEQIEGQWYVYVSEMQLVPVLGDQATSLEDAKAKALQWVRDRRGHEHTQEVSNASNS